MNFKIGVVDGAPDAGCLLIPARSHNGRTTQKGKSFDCRDILDRRFHLPTNRLHFQEGAFFLVVFVSFSALAYALEFFVKLALSILYPLPAIGDERAGFLWE